MKLLTNGITLDNSHAVVAADAISKISGVDLKTTIKVFNAIAAVSQAFPEISSGDIVSPHRVPAEAADAVRYSNTEEFVIHVIHALQKTPQGRALITRLRLDKRFPFEGTAQPARAAN